MSKRNKTIATYLLVVILFILITIGYTWPLAANAGNHLPGQGGGDSVFHLYVISWNTNTLQSNPLNLYNASIFFPNKNTLAYSDNELLTSLVAWPVLAASGNPVLGLNFYVILSFIISSVGGFLLVNHLTGDKLGALAGGVIIGFPLFKLAHIGHLQLLGTGFIPLALLFLHLYTEKRKARYASLFALCIVLVFWTAWGYGFFLAYATVLYLAVLAVMKRREIGDLVKKRAKITDRKRVYWWGLNLLIPILVALFILYPFAAPYLKTGKENPQFKRDIDELYHYSPDVMDFLVAPEASLVWGKATEPFRPGSYTRGNPSERSLFLGILPVLLSIFGILYLRKKGKFKERFAFIYYTLLLATSAVLCLGVALYAFGRYTRIPMPFRALYYLFPGFKAVRTPGRMLVLVVLALGVLAGFGIKWIREKLAGRLKSPAVYAVIVIILAVLLVEMLPAGLAVSPVPLKEEFPKVYTWMDSLEGPSPTVVLPLAAYDPHRGNSGRTEFVEWEPWRTYYNTANWKKTINGYSGFVPESYTDTAAEMEEFPNKSSIDYLKRIGIEYIVIDNELYGDKKVDEILGWANRHEGLKEVFSSKDHYAFKLQ